MQYEKHGGLKIASSLYQLVNDTIIPGTNVDSKVFWSGFEKVVNELAPTNEKLLKKRDDIQAQLDEWYKSNPNYSSDEYKKFITEIGYLVPEKETFSIETENVDPEISSIAGPQLVVPITNARFALNAANARWGSLYDALYGTDAIPLTKSASETKGYDPERGKEVIKKAAEFLDQAIPLTSGSHTEAKLYSISGQNIKIELIDGTETQLQQPEKYVGYTGDEKNPSSILFSNNNLHLEIIIDENDPIGKSSSAGIKDIILESAISAIMDCEDSVAAVDAEDKCLAYKNWLGLMKGDLQESFKKNGNTITRVLAEDKKYIDVNGIEKSLHGRSLLLVRNVGHLMTNPAILFGDDQEIPEGIMDAFITTLCAIHNFNGNARLNNSRTGSIYIVKPKMHGPEEVAFANRLFNEVEDVLGLARNTMKIGVMDEERRTTVNLKECIRQVKERIVFINTGFLDRTGDEIHTSMNAGAFLPKADIKGQPWIAAYEDWNVDIGLETGFSGKAQIGKGMWAEPDNMKAMLDAKIGHPKSGANCAWVPSPTAATLHATHYHQIDVFAQQNALKTRSRANLDDILTLPLLNGKNLSDDEINRELANNAQGILGYVVRWVDQGIGCSKVPDINDTGLMEDRATLRISSQHIANWLHHGICTKEQVLDILKQMARVVDTQNENDAAYQPMSGNFNNSIAFKAACDLVFEGINQPSGYTEPILHAMRLKAKAA